MPFKLKLIEETTFIFRSIESHLSGIISPGHLRSCQSAASVGEIQKEGNKPINRVRNDKSG